MTAARVIKKIIKAILPYGLVVLLVITKKHILFRKKRRRIDTVASLLADEKSKEVYIGINKARYGLCEFGKFYTTQSQYFENDFFTYSENEFLIDCGAYTGDTIESFIKFVPNYKGIISFEAIPTNFEILKKTHGNNPKIQLINKGVWSETGKLTFSSNGPGSTVISPSGKGNEINIDVVSIDSLNLQEKITLIKMDIEGAELNALKGASQTILRDRPKLAICIYHSDEDMIQIPEYINKLCPEYKLYVRHHFINSWETVLYGCP